MEYRFLSSAISVLPLELFWVGRPIQKFILGLCIFLWSFFCDLTIITVGRLPSVRTARDMTAYIKWRGRSYSKAWLWTRIGHPGLGRCFWLFYGLLGYVCVHVHIFFVCNNVHLYLSVCACVCICISLRGTLSILTQKLCLHFHFPNPAGPSPNLPWQLLSTRQTCPTPPPHSRPLSYAASLRPRC